MNFISLVLQVVFLAHSEPFEISDLTSVKATQCTQALSRLGSALMSDYREVFPGEFDLLPTLLVSSGVGVNEAHIAYQATKSILEHPPNSQILKELSDAFKKPSFKRELFFCATNPECRDKAGLIVQGSIFNRFRLTDFSRSSPPPEGNALWNDSPFIIRAILFPGGDHPIYLEPIHFVPILLHELTHVADTEKLMRWIEKNNRVPPLERDPLFSKVVRVGASGVEMDYGFFVTYLEGRAYLADRDARKHFQNIGLPPKYSESELADMGYNQIKEQCGEKYLNLFGVTRHNFFEKFEQIDLSH